MPWKESCKMDERIKFISRFKEGEIEASAVGEMGIRLLLKLTTSYKKKK